MEQHIKDSFKLSPETPKIQSSVKHSHSLSPSKLVYGYVLIPLPLTSGWQPTRQNPVNNSRGPSIPPTPPSFGLALLVHALYFTGKLHCYVFSSLSLTPAGYEQSYVWKKKSKKKWCRKKIVYCIGPRDLKSAPVQSRLFADLNPIALHETATDFSSILVSEL